MNVLNFWMEKFSFMCYFACHREWMLVGEEWKMTYAELEEAKNNSYKLYREACARLLKGIE